VADREGEGLKAVYVVGKKLGGAVRRNRIRRLLREAFRFVGQRSKAGADVALIPKRAIQGAGLYDLKQEIEKILKDAGLI
jgi:ribonuclease P protein component